MKKILSKIDIISIVLTFTIIVYCYLKFINLNRIKTGYIFIIIIVVLFIFLQFILNYFKKKNIKLEYIYLFFSIIIGLGYLIFLPVQRTYDSRNDYLRSLEVSEFHLTSNIENKKVGRSYSKNISKVYGIYREDGVKYKDVLDLIDIKLDKDEQYYQFLNKAVYPFTCYIPQAIGVGIGKLLNLSIYFQSILGKIFNYSFFVFCIFLAIKYIPVKKELVFFISMIPMTIQEAISLSPDSMIICTCICFASLLIYFKHSKKKINLKLKTFFFILTVLIAMCKIVYVPLCFLSFLIPSEGFKSKKEKMKYCIILCLVSVFGNMLWLQISSGYLSSIDKYINIKKQIHYILTNFLHYFVIIFRTVKAYIYNWINQIIGGNIGVHNISTSKIFALISFYLLIYYIVTSKNENKKTIFSIYEKIFIFIVVLSVIFLIFTSLYVYYTTPYLSHVEGIQGRYFIPLLMFLSMFFIKDDKNKEYDNLIKYSFLLNVSALVSIITCFI